MVGQFGLLWLCSVGSIILTLEDILQPVLDHLSSLPVSELQALAHNRVYRICLSRAWTLSVDDEQCENGEPGFYLCVFKTSPTDLHIASAWYSLVNKWNNEWRPTIDPVLARQPGGKRGNDISTGKTGVGVRVCLWKFMNLCAYEYVSVLVCYKYERIWESVISVCMCMCVCVCVCVCVLWVWKSLGNYVGCVCVCVCVCVLCGMYVYICM